MEEIVAMFESCSAGQKCYWEAVRALNGGDSRATAVAVQKFLDADGVECTTPKGNADAAAKHFTKVCMQHHARTPAGSSGGRRLGQAEADEN